jgi:hypothetical protein
MEFLIVVACAITVFAGGFYMGYVRCSRDMITELTDLVLENIADLNHEIVENQHYLYYKDTGEFAAQGATLDEAAKNFSLRDNGIGRVETSLGKHLFIVDGKLETQ